MTDDAIPTLPAWLTERPRPSVPGRVGKFEVLEKLGEGGAGEVWAARDPTLQRRIALKLVRRDRVGGEQETRLLREAHALATLSHPHVVTVHDAQTTDDFVYIAMELCEGGTLKEAFADPERGPRERLELLLQAGRGLQAAHARGLVHRDFKPANALLGRDGRVRVADFGLARLADPTGLPEAGPPTALATSFGELTVTGALLGTPAYMSPEQRLGQPVTPASDQFSFCVVAWQALYGHNPLATLDLAAWMAGEAKIPAPHAPPEIPATVEAALRRGLEPEAGDRHPSMAPILRTLEVALAPPRRARRWLALAGLTVAGLVGASFFLPTDAVCEVPSLDWAAARSARLAALSPAARTTATAALRELATDWNTQTQATCGLASSPCLQQRAAAFETATTVLSRPGAETVLPQVLDALAAPCAPGGTPTDVELARLRVLLAAGDVEMVLAASQRLESLDIDAPLTRVSVLRLRAGAQLDAGDPDGALDPLRVAYNEAERAGLDTVGAALAAEVATLTLTRLGQPERSEVWLATAQSVPDPPPEVEAIVAMARGRVLGAQGSWSRAADAFSRAAALRAEAPWFTDGPAEAQLLAADALAETGARSEARALAKAALRRREALLGPRHPRVQAAREVLSRL